MTPERYRDFLYDSIPLTRAMQLQVLQTDPDAVRLSAPLAPNINHHGTAFGGALAALGIVAGWTLVDLRLRAAGLHADLVVRDSELRYLRPATGVLIARSQLAGEDGDSFIESLRRGERGRLVVLTTIHSEGVEAVQLKTRYVALPRAADRGAGAVPPA